MSTSSHAIVVPQSQNGHLDRQALLDFVTQHFPEDKVNIENLLAQFDLARNQGTIAGPKAHIGSTWEDMQKLVGPVQWDWPGWFPRGLLTMIVAQSGMGKSALALRIASPYLQGKPWPDGTSFQGDLGKVLWAEAEAAQTINLERATEWGLPLDQFLTPFSDPLLDFDLTDHDHREALTTLSARPDVKLVIVDSLTGAANDDDKPDTKAAVKWLADLAKMVNKPVLLTHHLRKRGLLDGEDISLDRVRGSSKIVQFARVVWALSQPDPTVDTKRLQVIKNNLGRFADPLGMEIYDQGINFGPAPELPRSETQQDKAADLLRVLLASGPVLVKDLKEEFEGAGISWNAANRAKAKLGIVSIKQSGDKTGPWVWSLPATEDM